MTAGSSCKCSRGSRDEDEDMGEREDEDEVQATEERGDFCRLPDACSRPIRLAELASRLSLVMRCG